MGLVALLSCDAPAPPAARRVEPTATPGLSSRTVLPIPEPGWSPAAEDSAPGVPPPRLVVRPPADAPNVLVVLLDDLGFAGTSVFGGPAHTPTLEALAGRGLRYNHFHTAGLGAPSRQALKTGRNHHTANLGRDPSEATGQPGYTAELPRSVAPLAEILRLNGYSTAAFGKWETTPPWQHSPIGPFDQWPTHQGFEHFYGFLGAETDAFTPVLYNGTTQHHPAGPDYYLTRDVTDAAVAWIAQQRAIAPDRPFFVYFAPPAAHAPLQVPEDWVDRYDGAFDAGWDALREITLKRQQDLGVVPTNAKLLPRPEGLPAWETLTETERLDAARGAELLASYVEYTDTEVGRIVETLRATGAIDDTLILYITGDSGSPFDGGRVGAIDALERRNGLTGLSARPDLQAIVDWGHPDAYPEVAAGWAWALDTPFTWGPPVASDFGATRTGLVVHWPRGIDSRGGLRTQFAHVTDIAPTILDAASLPEPTKVHGVPQTPMAGASLRPTFEDASAPSPHSDQYFEIGGNRGYWRDGWFVRAVHRSPFQVQVGALDADLWQLYDTRRDFTLAEDRASEDPERLAAMRDAFHGAARRNPVFPLDDRVGLSDAQADRPSPMAGRNNITLRPGGPGLPESSFLALGGRSYEIAAQVDVKKGDSGVLIAQGGRHGGWALHLDGGRPTYTQNWLGRLRSVVQGPPLTAGQHRIVVELTYRGSALGQADAVLKVDGAEVASGLLTATHSVTWGPETVDVGLDRGSAVGTYTSPSAFTGKLAFVTVTLKER